MYIIIYSLCILYGCMHAAVQTYCATNYRIIKLDLISKVQNKENVCVRNTLDGAEHNEIFDNVTISTCNMQIRMRS